MNIEFQILLKKEVYIYIFYQQTLIIINIRLINQLINHLLNLIFLLEFQDYSKRKGSIAFQYQIFYNKQSLKVLQSAYFRLFQLANYIMNSAQDSQSTFQQFQAMYGLPQNYPNNTQQFQQQGLGNMASNVNKQQLQVIQSISEAPEKDESSALNFDEDLIYSQRLNSQILEQSLNQKQQILQSQGQPFNSIYSQINMDLLQQNTNGSQKQKLKTVQQNQQVRNQYYTEQVDHVNNKKSNNASNVTNQSGLKQTLQTNSDEIQRLIKESSQRIVQTEQLVTAIDERFSEGSSLPQRQADIPFEIKDYAIQGNVSAKQSLLTSEKNEFFQSQDQDLNSNQTHQNQQISIPQKDPRKQEMLDSLQQNLNFVMQKNIQKQQVSPRANQLLQQQQINQMQQKQNQSSSKEEFNPVQFDNYFQQNIQKQLQNIQQIKSNMQNPSQNQQFSQYSNQEMIASLQQLQLDQNQIEKDLIPHHQAISNQNQQLNLENNETHAIIEKKNQQKNNSDRNQFQDKQQHKPKDYMNIHKQVLQNRIAGQNTILSSNQKNQLQQQQIHQGQSQNQMNQYIPLYQQIQNQININNKELQQNQSQIQQIQSNTRDQQDVQVQPQKDQNYELKQQLIEKQKQIILKKYEEAILKEQQELLKQQQLQNQQKISQNKNEDNGLQNREKRASAEIQKIEANNELSPARTKTIDEHSSNGASPKHIYLKLEKYKQENEQTQENTQSNQKLNTEGNQRQPQRNSSQKQLSSEKNVHNNAQNFNNKNMQKQQAFSTVTDKKANEQQTYKQMGYQQQQQKDINSQLLQKKGSSYQNQSSLSLIRRMMEQKDFKKLEVPKDFDSSEKGYQDYRISYENQYSPEIRNKKKTFQNEDEQNKTKDNLKKTETSATNSQENQKSQENQSHIANGGLEQSFQDDKKTDVSIQSMSVTNPMKLSNASRNGKMRTSQESLKKSFEERKKYTFAINNQKCIIFTKDTSQQQQQNANLKNSQIQNQSQVNQKIGSGIASQEDLYFVYGSSEQSLHNNQAPNNQYVGNQLDQQSQHLQNYYNQHVYEDQVRQSQILQYEDEEALQHQQYLREQDLLHQQQFGYNPNQPSPQVYEYTEQGFMKTNQIDKNSKNLSQIPIIHDFEEANSEIHNIEQSQLQSGIMNSNHMTFGPNQSNNLKQQIIPSQLESIQTEPYQVQSSVVSVNQILKMNQIQGNQAINLESYQVSNIQSPDNHRMQQGVSSVYSSIVHLSPQSQNQQNQLRGRLGSNNIKLNTSTDTCNMSRISNKTGNNLIQNNNKQGNYRLANQNINTSSTYKMQTQQNQSYISAASNSNVNNNRKDNNRAYTSNDEHTPQSSSQVNKKDFNWLDYSSFERNNIWLKLKNQNRQMLQQEMNEKEKVECTFKPSLIASKKTFTQQQSNQSRIQTTKPVSSYSTSKKNNVRDNSDNSRLLINKEGQNQNPTANTTINITNNGYSQNNSIYQIGATQANLATVSNKLTKPNLFQQNLSPQSKLGYHQQYLSQVQSPSSLHQVIKKASSYKQINQLKKNISTSNNVYNGIASSVPNSTQNRLNTQQSQKKLQPYQQNRPIGTHY
ncbi:transmembrane protein, putative (macronuclear) [Tetrahymena thermophila SB210]|uniref:Transmembrane protein, putative n=1 Tax=Tetrahymena thermophila (strain SB210) TaxID=312017 RepID=Q24IJ8_TETTS|nr:transmembrane protein, putative [Tetrahymena thermophila SB210]EAS07627.2 transmembrane protein, putative [Tetrahymena thermophila SB210]|eukprot:XP_001027869.2 transmembrane protein, putative [Tetrahymena thermophila SB210]